MSPENKDRPELAPPDPGKDPDAPRHAAYGPLDAAREAGQPEGPVGVAAAPARGQLPDDHGELRDKQAEVTAEVKQNPTPYAGALGALAGLILLVLLLRRRSS